MKNTNQVDTGTRRAGRPRNTSGNRNTAFLLLPAFIILLGIAAIIGRQYQDAANHVLRSDVTDDGTMLGEIRESGALLAEYGGMSVYLKDSVLSVVAARGSDTDPGFLLWVFPQDKSVLPEDRKSKGFVNLNFDFAGNLAFTVAGTGENVAQVSLKNLGYVPARLDIGQYDKKGDIWKKTISLSGIWPGIALKASVQDNGDMRRSITEEGAFLAQREGITIYLWDSALYVFAAKGSDTSSGFVLWVFPQDKSALPPDRQEKGFENLNFDFAGHLAFSVAGTGENVAKKSLKDLAYTPVRLDIGQYDSKGEIWKKSISLSRIWPGKALRSDVLDNGEMLSAVKEQGILLAEENGLSFYLKDSAVYAVAPWGSDINSRIVLWVFPNDKSMLPPERQSKGFENRDFLFADRLVFTTAASGINVARMPLDVSYAPDRIELAQADSKGDIWRKSIDIPVSESSAPADTGD